jgi:hypothetical protein
VIGCVDPAHPTVDSPYLYGDSIGAMATSALVQGLTNGKQVKVALAAFDAVDNIGPLSVIQCQTPQPTETFFNQYCADGGAACQGGCGSCNVGSDRDLGSLAFSAALLSCVALGVRRDRRRRSRAAQQGARRPS